MIRLLTILAVISLMACQPKEPDPRAEIRTLEAELGDQVTEEQLKTLLAAYDTYIKSHPTDTASATYLYRGAGMLYQTGRYNRSVENLKTGILHYHDSPQARQMAKLLAKIYEENLDSPYQALTTHQAILHAYPTIDTRPQIEAKIPAGTAPLVTRLDSLRFTIFSEADGPPSRPMGKSFIEQTELYALLLPDHEKSPLYLMQAGEMARNIEDYQEAIHMYELMRERYPNHQRAAQALFLVGFIQENNLKDKAAARATYENFLATYPEDEFAASAEFLLENLDKTDEEILESFQQKEQ